MISSHIFDGKLACFMLLALAIDYKVADIEAFLTTRKTSSNRLSQYPAFLKASIVEGTGTTGVSEAVALDWSFLDGVYLIHCPNADPEGKRLQTTQTVLNGVNLLDDLAIKEFETDDENRIRGCYTSHLSVYRDIVNDNKKSIPFDFFAAFQPKTDDVDKNVLILEDNVAVNGKIPTPEILASIASFVKTNQDWDIVHLAYIPYVPELQVSKTNDEKIVKLSTGVGSALGTTAYIINTKAMKRLIQQDEEQGFQMPIPDVMAKLFGESRYASYPTLFVRAPTTKSLVNPQLDDLREILFQPLVTAFAQQLLVLTGLSTNALLPVIVLTLLLTSLTSLQTSFHFAVDFLSTGAVNGPWIVPLLSVPFSVFSLGIIVQGALLAPKPEPSENNDEER
jgi:GR25 family glycosyltransferase involved in LPS biosynthesis